jgi:phosphate transport system permease protein
MSAEARNDILIRRHLERAEARRAAQQRARLYDRIGTGVLLAAVGLLVFILLLIIGRLLVLGLPQLSWTFITSASSLTQPGGGVGPQLWCTMYVLILSLLFTVPLGVGAAIYLEEFARPTRFTNTVRFSVEALSTVPSVVFGTFGAAIFLVTFGLGFSVFAGALTISLLNLPLMVRVSQEAIRSVPKEFREASQALAAQPWETIRKLVLPSALPGIITGIVLTSGRVIGETAPLILTMGTSISPNARFSFDPFLPGETLAVRIWVLKVIGVPGLQDADAVANGAAALLLLIVLTLSIGSTLLTRRLTRRLRGLN